MLTGIEVLLARTQTRGLVGKVVDPLYQRNRTAADGLEVFLEIQ